MRTSAGAQWRVWPRFAPGNNARRVTLWFDDERLTQREDGVDGATWQTPAVALEDRTAWSFAGWAILQATAAGTRYHWWGRGSIPTWWRGDTARSTWRWIVLVVLALVPLTVSWLVPPTKTVDVRVRHAASLAFANAELPREFHSVSRGPLALWVPPRTASLVSALATAPPRVARAFEQCAHVARASDPLFGPGAPLEVALASSGLVQSSLTGLRVGVTADTLLSRAGVGRDERFLSVPSNMRCLAVTVAATVTGRSVPSRLQTSGWSVRGGGGQPFGMFATGPADDTHHVLLLYAARGRDEVIQFGWVANSSLAAATFEWQRVAAIETRRLEGLSAPSPGD